METLLQGALWIQGGRGTVKAASPLGIRQEEHCFGVLQGRGAECGRPDQEKVPFVKDGPSTLRRVNSRELVWR